MRDKREEQEKEAAAETAAADEAAAEKAAAKEAAAEEGPPSSFVPADASTCLSTTPGVTDNWCQDTCGSGACTVGLCICDEEAAKILKKQEEQVKQAAADKKAAAEAAAAEQAREAAELPEPSPIQMDMPDVPFSATPIPSPAATSGSAPLPGSWEGGGGAATGVGAQASRQSSIGVPTVMTGRPAQPAGTQGGNIGDDCWSACGDKPGKCFNATTGEGYCGLVATDPTWSWSGSCCIFGSPIGTQCENRGCLNKHCCVEDFDTP